MRRWALTILCLVIVLSGCRSASPVAPKQEVDSVLSSLGLYCGRAIQLEAFGERAEANFALKRGGEPEEVVGAAVYFASAASSFCTGSVLRLDGGGG